jgi:CheY-like chemotaxis protein
VPYTLLLADDSVTIQRVIELTFADEDVVVVAVSDGDQAIARLEASPPDIVLADIGMPGKNGYEVAQYIRQSPHLAHIPVVLLTGAFEPVDQARAAEAGCDGVLAKPFEPQLVIGRVKELLARKNRPPEASSGDLPRPSLVPDDQWAPPPADTPVAAASPAAPAALDDYFDRLDAAFSQLSPKPVPPTAAATTGPDLDWFSTTPAGTPATDSWDLPAQADRSEPTDLPLAYASPYSPASPFAALVPPAPAEPVPQAEPPAPVEPRASLAVFAPHGLSAPVAPPAPPAVSPLDAFSGPLAPDVAPPAESVHVAAPAAAFVATPADAVAPAAPVAPTVPAAPARHGELPSLADAFAALLAAEQGEPLPATAPRWPGTANAAPSDTGTALDTDALVEDITARVLDRLSDQVVRETVAEIVSRVAEQLVREEIERIKASIKM